MSRSPGAAKASHTHPPAASTEPDPEPTGLRYLARFPEPLVISAIYAAALAAGIIAAIAIARS